MTPSTNPQISCSECEFSRCVANYDKTIKSPIVWVCLFLEEPLVLSDPTSWAYTDVYGERSRECPIDALNKGE